MLTAESGTGKRRETFFTYRDLTGKLEMKSLFFSENTGIYILIDEKFLHYSAGK